MEVKIKASAVANLTDARYFAAREVEWLGFCLDKNASEYMQPMVVKALKEWIEGPKIIGEFGMQTSSEILEAVEYIGLDGVQLGMYNEVNMTILRQKTLVIREIVVEKDTKVSDFWEMSMRFGNECDYLLLNFEKNGITWHDLLASREINIELLERLCQKYPIIVELSFLPQQLMSILHVLQPLGLSLKGGDEEKVGLKSFDELDEVLDLLEK
jgi:phosphoribosylanthranilate isomerase